MSNYKNNKFYFLKNLKFKTHNILNVLNLEFSRIIKFINSSQSIEPSEFVSILMNNCTSSLFDNPSPITSPKADTNSSSSSAPPWSVSAWLNFSLSCKSLVLLIFSLNEANTLNGSYSASSISESESLSMFDMISFTSSVKI